MMERRVLPVRRIGHDTQSSPRRVCRIGNVGDIARIIEWDLLPGPADSRQQELPAPVDFWAPGSGEIRINGNS